MQYDPAGESETGGLLDHHLTLAAHAGLKRDSTISGISQPVNSSQLQSYLEHCYRVYNTAIDLEEVESHPFPVLIRDSRMNGICDSFFKGPGHYTNYLPLSR